MPDLSKATEDFDGMDYGHKAMEWPGKIEDGAILHGWPKVWKLEMARVHLRGAATNWYSPKRGRIRSWTDFRRLFETTFGVKKSLTKR